MIHGLGVSAASLGPLAEQLARDAVVLVCDLPGFGLTGADVVWRTGAAADVLEEVLELRSLGRVTLVGHSWGCHVAAVLAARHPDRVSALVLLSPAFDGRGGAAGQIARLAADSPMERPSLVAGAARDYLRAGLPRVLTTLREAAALPLDEIIAGVRAPVLVVRGSRDPLTTGRWARRIAARAGRARVAVIPGAAHGLGHDAPRAVAGAIGAFLTGEGHPPRIAPTGPLRPSPGR